MRSGRRAPARGNGGPPSGRGAAWESAHLAGRRCRVGIGPCSPGAAGMGITPCSPGAAGMGITPCLPGAAGMGITPCLPGAAGMGITPCSPGAAGVSAHTAMQLMAC
ncbi:hypothetical protein I1B99_004924 [Escherichia coli]|uniref:hypothetical protein n=1 Tax=Escherichia coli TaxID=562 RepID=UPI0013EF9DFB|nr:hypothetical protein [Escherichia coli]EFJ8960771.1 hypothetical protein [Escherichia coli]EGM9466912.1 hypothetical protein [Escherichia coli]EGP9778433.1 hypothetical protein [Escherichia coli]EIY5793526.1 hypothetical protein [Escherichia coli]HCA7964657.1 hypothetical protein [Escherichia coli]